MIRADTLSGLRAGELCRLRWEEVDFGRGVIHVRWLPELGQHGRIKTGRERLVPICAELKEVLRPYAERDGWSGFVFRNGCRGSVNAFATVKTLRRQLVLARRIAGLPDVTFHVLRHTRASWWAQAGVPMPKIARWLGHSVEVCVRYYSGLQQGYDPDCERST